MPVSRGKEMEIWFILDLCSEVQQHLSITLIHKTFHNNFYTVTSANRNILYVISIFVIIIYEER